MPSFNITHWWDFLRAIAACNVVTWTFATAAVVRRRDDTLSAESHRAWRRQLLLSAVYVFGCALRSFVPVYDIGRVGLVDSWLSSVLLGRCVAMVAELSFVTQWALMLRQSAVAAGRATVAIMAQAIVPLIVAAELCYWYSVLTTSNVGQILEAILWGSSAAVAVIGLSLVQARYTGARRRLMVAWCVAGAAYVAFMFLYDLPMYWSRWLTDLAQGHHDLSIARGLLDIVHHRVVSYRWEDWKGEIIWMSLYFSVGVWVSISLAYASGRWAESGAARSDRSGALGADRERGPAQSARATHDRKPYPARAYPKRGS